MDGLSLEYSKDFDSYSQADSDKILDNLKKIIESDSVGFFGLPEREDLLEEVVSVFARFKNKKKLYHIGIGGSALGPQTIYKSLGPFNDKKMTFLNNIDPDDVYSKLKNFNLEQSFFLIVSKSGGTAETMASLAIVSNILKENGVQEESFKDYFIFATEKENGELYKIGKELGISTLSVPANVGGRYGVLTTYGLFPCLFLGLDPQRLLLGAREVKQKILEQNSEKNALLKMSKIIIESYKKNNIDQTVLMPYSTKLRSLSDWFVQLWAESLGKQKNIHNEDVFLGLTPIPAYGATDQHAQMQLFMDGPANKLIIFIEVENFKHDYSLESEFQSKAHKTLAPFRLTTLIKAELEGAKKALKEKDRPWICLKIKTLDEYHLGALFLFLESLTVSVGQQLEIDPFNQPGVELGKIYSFKWLENLNK